MIACRKKIERKIFFLQLKVAIFSIFKVKIYFMIYKILQAFLFTKINLPFKKFTT